MKLSDEARLAIYELRNNKVSCSRLSQQYDIQVSNLKDMVRIMYRYGVEIVRKRKTGTILHSDQVWKVQQQSYHYILETKGIHLFMSRKGHSPDNSMVESFFGILKFEMFYGFIKSSYQSFDELERSITNIFFTTTTNGLKLN